MTVPVLKRPGIAIKVTDSTGAEHYVLEKWQEVEIPVPGIYTLEGPNQSGKSVLIKLLMGAVAPSLSVDERELPVLIGEWKGHIRHVGDALARGLVAVFQDDDLIPSMTISDQLLMRHATPTWKNWLAAGRRVAYDKLKLGSIAWLGQGERLRSLNPSDSEVFPPDLVRNRARALLRGYGADYEGILDKYPRQLSGGAKAVARLVQAQLTPNIRILFLDEAFSGVQADVWPNLVESLKQWAEASEATVVVVSHNQRELMAWQPRQRFVIEGSQLRETGISGYLSLQPGHPARTDAFPIFGAQYRHWVTPFRGPAVVLMDAGVAPLRPTRRLLRYLEDQGVAPIKDISIPITESTKSWDNFKHLTEATVDVIRRPEGMLVAVGGGALLNLAGVVASVLHRGGVPLVQVPTTLMAIADVVVGSKSAVNLAAVPGRPALKNVIGAFANPSAVVLDPAFIEYLPAAQIRLGLSESVKHGVLQDEDLYEDCLEVMCATSPPTDAAFELARRTMELKRTLLAIDPWELTQARILLYGHLHAHAIERLSEFSIPHGSSVLIGVAMDLVATGHEGVAKDLIRRVSRAGCVSVLPAWTNAELLRAYELDTHLDHGVPVVVDLKEVGEYAHPYSQPVRCVNLEWDILLDAHRTVRSWLA